MTITIITRPVSSSHTSLCVALMARVHALCRCHHATSCLGGFRAQARATWSKVGLLLSGRKMPVVDRHLSVASGVVVQLAEVIYAVFWEADSLLHNRRVLTNPSTLPHPIHLACSRGACDDHNENGCVMNLSTCLTVCGQSPYQLVHVYVRNAIDNKLPSL